MTKTVINLDDDLHEWLKEHKQAEGRTIEWTINQALKEYKEKNQIKEMELK